MNDVENFEKQFAEYFNVAYAFAVNSPFMANMLMFSMLEHKYLINGYDKRYFKGDIIVPATCPPHTFLPLHHLGFKINAVDIDENTLNIDAHKIYDALTPHTRAILCFNTLGNSADYYRIRQVAKEQDLMLIEDVTTSFGSIADSDEYCGTIGQLGTFAYQGKGVVVCRTQDDANWLRTLRDGGLMRDHETHKWFKDGHNQKVFLKTNEFKDTYSTVTPGFDVKPESISSDFLTNWPRIKENRTNNGDYWKTRMRTLPCFNTQKEIGVSSWEGLTLVCQGIMYDKRDLVVEALKKVKDIEVKPIFTHVLKNPISNQMKVMSSDLKVSDNIYENGLHIVNYDYECEDKIDEIYDTLKELEMSIEKD
jgi:dTDP-4-amino-4,6-dideoxygalactose transaminase